MNFFEIRDRVDNKTSIESNVTFVKNSSFRLFNYIWKDPSFFSLRWKSNAGPPINSRQQRFILLRSSLFPGIPRRSVFLVLPEDVAGERRDRRSKSEPQHSQSLPPQGRNIDSASQSHAKNHKGLKSSQKSTRWTSSGYSTSARFFPVGKVR